MQLLKTKTLTPEQAAQIDRLWDEEFIQSLNGRFKTLLDDNENHLHHLLLDESGNVAGWTVQFERDGGMWFSIIVPAAQQGKGYGKRLLESLQSELDEFFGWVADREGEVKADGSAYRNPMPFYLKHGFELLPGERLDTEIISAVKIRWRRRDALSERQNFSTMNPLSDYKEINRQLWNARTDAHVSSGFYDVEGFLAGASSLNSIELELLGDVADKNILHLQCHFGQDSLSLARMGARVTGADLSDNAIRRAQELAAKTGADARFVCCDLYELPQHLDDRFDIVFTSYGTIGWLPDLEKWAGVVSHFLKPGGRFVFVDFHPVVWMFDDDFREVAYRYFNSGPIVETENGTYADRDADIHHQSVGWNHSISEVVNNLIGQGLTIRSLDEFDYSPYDVFRAGVEEEPKKFRVAHMGNRIPMVYAIVAEKGAINSGGS